MYNFSCRLLLKLEDEKTNDCQKQEKGWCEFVTDLWNVKFPSLRQETHQREVVPDQTICQYGFEESLDVRKNDLTYYLNQTDEIEEKSKAETKPSCEPDITGESGSYASASFFVSMELLLYTVHLVHLRFLEFSHIGAVGFIMPRSRRSCTMGKADCVCVCSSCNCSTVTMRRKLTGSIGF